MGYVESNTMSKYNSYRDTSIMKVIKIVRMKRLVHIVTTKDNAPCPVRRQQEARRPKRRQLASELRKTYKF
jgi:5'-3' exonuclease